MPLRPSTAISPKPLSSISPSPHALFPPGQLIPFALVTFLFFLWGIPNSMNDVLIRQFM